MSLRTDNFWRIVYSRDGEIFRLLFLQHGFFLVCAGSVQFWRYADVLGSDWAEKRQIDSTDQTTCAYVYNRRLAIYEWLGVQAEGNDNEL